MIDVDHEHDDDVTSFAFRETKPLALDLIEDFLDGVVQVYCTQLMRYKGILNIKNMDHRVIFQGVHMMMGRSKGSAWKPCELRETKVVFIGRDLPKDTLIEGLSKCVVTARAKL